MNRIKMHISKVKLPFYPPCEVQCRLQNKVSTPIFKRDNQPLDSRLALMARSTSSKITECSAQILIQFLKSLTTTVVLKQLNPRRRHRRGRGNHISSSLPRHGARIKDQQHPANRKKNKNKTKDRLQVSTKKIQNKRNYMMHEQINDMMHELRQ